MIGLAFHMHPFAQSSMEQAPRGKHQFGRNRESLSFWCSLPNIPCLSPRIDMHPTLFPCLGCSNGRFIFQRSAVIELYWPESHLQKLEGRSKMAAGPHHPNPPLNSQDKSNFILAQGIKQPELSSVRNRTVGDGG